MIFSELPREWQGFAQACQSCQNCDLYRSRNQIVIYRGGLKAPLMIIGEGPGREEDLQGKPFVGRSGRLMDSALRALEIPEDKVHICNIVKCRPPENRTPTEEEAVACRRLLAAQFTLVQPKVVLVCGATAYRYFTGRKDPISSARGQWIDSRGIQVMPTFHPAYLLRNMGKRDLFWSDIYQARQVLEQMGLIDPMQNPLNAP